MPKEVTIKLDPPIRGYDRTITEIKVREPSFSEYIQNGDPYTLAQAPGSGIPFLLENQAAIEAYTKACVVYDGFDALLLEQAGLQAARRIKEAVFGFFRPGGEVSEASVAESGTSPTSSSSTAAAPSTP